MSYNPNAGMNSMLRRAGNRSRAVVPPALPNIGQTPAVQAANLVQAQRQQIPQQPMAAPPASAPGTAQRPVAPGPNPLAAPNVQPNALMMHPPGSPPDPNQYNYSPQPDGSWLVHPPGVPAPANLAQASLPRAASTADYKRMREAFQQVPQQ